MAFWAYHRKIRDRKSRAVRRSIESKTPHNRKAALPMFMFDTLITAALMSTILQSGEEEY
jgi:hypothetical protein